MAQRDAQQPGRMFRGTIEEVLSHRSEISPGTTVELKVLEQAPEAEEDGAFGGKTLAEMIEEIGTVKGLPADLATNPAHMHGFGEVRSNPAQ